MKSGAVSNKKTNSFRGISGNVGGVTEGDQPNPNSFLSPYEQLEAESEALVSKLLDMVCPMLNTTPNVNSAAYQEAKSQYIPNHSP